MKQTWVRMVIVAASLTVMLIALAACNTVRGVGEDIEATGQAVQDVAD